MSTIFVHDGTGYTPDGSIGEMTREDADRRNREASAQEVEDFKANAPSPYFAYYRATTIGRIRRWDLISTWMGDRLATVTWTGKPYLQGRRQNFRALSIDGETVYSGTAYLSAGDYVRMRKVKSHA